MIPDRLGNLHVVRLFIATLLIAPLIAVAAPADETAIRKVMTSTWDKPESRLEISPGVVSGDWAIAGWTQGERGGRALMLRSRHGDWSVLACGGDGLKDAKALAMTGMPEPTARTLAASLAKAEARLPASRLAKFSTFDGLVRMDAAGHHPPAASAAKH